MGAAPGSILDDLDFVRRRKLFQKLSIVGQAHMGLRLNGMESISQRHVAIAMMMAIGLAIGGNVHELGPGAGIRKSALESRGKLLSTIEQFFKRYCLGDRAVVEEKIDLASGRQLLQISAGGINTASAYIFPGPAAQFARPASLTRRQYRELNAQLSKHVQRFQIYGGFRKPYAFRVAPKTPFKIANAPQDLRVFIARIGQRQDGMIVGLSDGRTMPGEALLALTI